MSLHDSGRARLLPSRASTQIRSIQGWLGRGLATPRKNGVTAPFIHATCWTKIEVQDTATVCRDSRRRRPERIEG
jgi:hypothetical protein